MQSNTFIRVLPSATGVTIKQVIDVATFERACDMAVKDPQAAADLLATYAEKVGSAAYVEFAKNCIQCPVGKVGTRRSLRAVGVMLLDKVIAKDPNYAPALCGKGEAMLPPIHVGKADTDVPGPVLKEVFNLFNKAAELGDNEGRFLRGRWLLSMSPVHKSTQLASEGKADIHAAVKEGLPRAMVFLAQCYEFPGRFSSISFAKELPSSRVAREKKVLDLYLRAANLGDPDALNDVGSSYATGYAGLTHDFDTAAKYYVRAIQAGSQHAFDNLGTHYETGMGGRAQDRIDIPRALHYYRHGARMRCSKCAHNLGAAYEEGMPGALEIDTRKAEKYYRHTLYLADDDNDTMTASRALKDLVALYITRLKVHAPDSRTAITTKELLSTHLPPRMLEDTVGDVNKAIETSVRGRKSMLNDLLGDHNARIVHNHATQLVDRVFRQNQTGEPTAEDKAALTHVFGSYTKESLLSGFAKGKGRGVNRRS